MYDNWNEFNLDKDLEELGQEIDEFAELMESLKDELQMADDLEFISTELGC